MPKAGDYRHTNEHLHHGPPPVIGHAKTGRSGIHLGTTKGADPKTGPKAKPALNPNRP